jgi:hypothetical protein
MDDDPTAFWGAHCLVVQEVELLRQEGGGGVVVRLAAYHFSSLEEGSEGREIRAR